MGGLLAAQVKYTSPQRHAHAHSHAARQLDDPALQWTTPIAARLGTEYQFGILSGAASGRLGSHSMFYSSAYDLRRNVHDLTTLTSGSAASPQALGISADSVARLTAIAGRSGSPLSFLARPRRCLPHKARRTLVLTSRQRLPRPPPARLQRAYILAGGARNSSGLGGGVTVLPSRLGESTYREGSLMSEYSRYIVGNALSETKTSFSVQEDHAAPNLNLAAWR